MNQVNQRREPVVVGVDVGSTTVKAVVLDPDTLEILWSDYQRHQTKQPEKVLELLEMIETAFPDSPRASWRMFLTGSGAAPDPVMNTRHCSRGDSGKHASMVSISSSTFSGCLVWWLW